MSMKRSSECKWLLTAVRLADVFELTVCRIIKKKFHSDTSKETNYTIYFFLRKVY